MLIIKNIDLSKHSGIKYSRKYEINDFLIYTEDNEIALQGKECFTLIFNYRYGIYQGFQSFLSIEDMQKKVNGVFSVLQIEYDTNKIQLICDAMGGTQIYYYHKDQEFIATNKMEAFKVLNVSLTPDKYYFYDYISASYWRERFSSPEHTPFMEVNRVCAGAALSITSNKISTMKWWSLDLINYRNKYRTFSSAKRAFESLLDNLCEGIFQRNSKVLLLLSAGMDSNLLLHYFKKKGYSKNIVVLIFMTSGGCEDECWDAKKSAMDAGVIKTLLVNENYQLIGDFDTKYELLPNEPSIQLLYNKKINLLNKICCDEKCDMIIDGNGGDHLFEIKFEFLYDSIIRNNHFANFCYRHFWANQETSYNRALYYAQKKVDSLSKRMRAGPSWLKPTRELVNLYKKRIGEKAVETIEYYKREFKYQIKSSLYSFSDMTHWDYNIRYISPLFDRTLIEFVAETSASVLWRRGINKFFLRKFGHTFMPSYIVGSMKKRNVPGDLRKEISRSINQIISELQMYCSNDEVVIENELMSRVKEYQTGIKVIDDDFDAINRYLSINRYYQIYRSNNK